MIFMNNSDEANHICIQKAIKMSILKIMSHTKPQRWGKLSFILTARDKNESIATPDDEFEWEPLRIDLQSY